MTVLKNSEDRYDFVCDYETGCGITTEDGHVPFASTGWPTKESAQVRGNQHHNEHENQEPMQEMQEFLNANNLYINNGLVMVRE